MSVRAARRLGGFVVCLLGLLRSCANAAGLDEYLYQKDPISSKPPDYAERFEARGGLFAHGIGSVEGNTVDINLELVSPRLPFGSTAPWAALVPRLEVGGFLNTLGRTSIGYAGLLWTVPIDQGFFWEPFFGGAANNGLRDGSATRSALGCSYGFNFGSSLGYRLDGPWSIIGTFNHMSNGNSSVGTSCPHNKGVNNLGVKVGYSF
jgi:hypothetical protein